MSQYSFRKILLLRLLFLTLPVLLMGVSFTYYVTYRKTRSALLETARKNVTESAIKKGKSLQELINLFKTNIINASNSENLKLENFTAQNQFIQEQINLLPEYLDCVQITNLIPEKKIISSCNQDMISQFQFKFSLEKKTDLENSDIEIKYIFPEPIKLKKNQTEKLQSSKQLQLIFTAPIYNNQGKLAAILSFQSFLLKLEILEAGLLTDYPIIINENGTFLVHPFPEKIGQNIKDQPDKKRLEILLKNAISGRQDYLHLFSLKQNEQELLAGYTAINSPISGEENQKWIVLAITTLDNALSPVKDIQKTLLYLLTILVLILTLTSLLAILYLAKELSQPLEKITKFAMKYQNNQENILFKYKFKIQEINELYQAINQMIESLKAGAKEIEIAWENAKNANQLKSEFLATTSHELRTPLNGIIGSIRLIKDGYCDTKEEELEFLEKADQAAIHLLDLINDVLDISKIEAGQMSLNLKPLNINNLLDEVINLQTGLIKSKNLTLKIEKYPHDIKVYGDYNRLKQVLINILGNAVKFTDFGTITIKTFLQENRENLTHFLVIYINDTGVGIPQEQQNKLFQPFVMVDGSTTRKFGGTGLGLAISKNLMEMMGGSINLSSLGDNQGTTVTINIPIVK